MLTPRTRISQGSVSRFSRLHERGAANGFRPDDLVDEKQIGEQRAEVNRRVEIVDQLRADRGLRQHQADCGAGVAGVSIQHGNERMVLFRWLELFALQDLREHVSEAVERLVALCQQRPKLRAAAAARLGPKTLRGIGEHELVALLNLPAAISELVTHDGSQMLFS